LLLLLRRLCRPLLLDRRWLREPWLLLYSGWRLGWPLMLGRW
jgi:hypothetical protein